MRLDELRWSQKDLAQAMAVSPQQINKIVRGKQNLKLETIVKLQNILQLPLLASATAVSDATIRENRKSSVKYRKETDYHSKTAGKIAPPRL